MLIAFGRGSSCWEGSTKEALPCRALAIWTPRKSWDNHAPRWWLGFCWRNVADEAVMADYQSGLVPAYVAMALVMMEGRPAADRRPCRGIDNEAPLLATSIGNAERV
ncbi:unnamed protein product [Ostreobium quekettii]|uniref:Uncharacterized protein n=1 Tax=Ostreobium quekettii TaxID=121088 RepID=A0A8S1IM75_9CHLO|nr:unnamed protein product [Ostreobium quekettii]